MLYAYQALNGEKTDKIASFSYQLKLVGVLKNFLTFCRLRVSKFFNNLLLSSGKRYRYIEGLEQSTEAKYPECKKQISNALRFEISSQKLSDLLAHHQICAADIHCLDEYSKQCLKNLCLKTCLLNISTSQTNQPKNKEILSNHVERKIA